MNTQITPLEIPLKGTETQLFIKTSTEGIYNPTGMVYWQALSEEGKELASGNIPLTVEEVEAWGGFYGLHRKYCLKQARIN